jgi:hypothetical protein
LEFLFIGRHWKWLKKVIKNTQITMAEITNGHIAFKVAVLGLSSQALKKCPQGTSHFFFSVSSVAKNKKHLYCNNLTNMLSYYHGLEYVFEYVFRAAAFSFVNAGRFPGLPAPQASPAFPVDKGGKTKTNPQGMVHD